jgi:hypothetical protein
MEAGRLARAPCAVGLRTGRVLFDASGGFEYNSLTLFSPLGDQAMSLQIRRWIVVVASLAFGVVLSWVIIYTNIQLIPPLELGPVGLPALYSGFGTNFMEFAPSNVVILVISLACIAAIWLDYFLGTKFLKS